MDLKGVAIECKNYKDSVNASKLLEFVSKAIRGKKFDPRTGLALPTNQSSELPKRTSNAWLCSMSLVTLLMTAYLCLYAYLMSLY